MSETPRRGAPPPPAPMDWSASVVGLKRKISRVLRLGGGPSDEELDETLRSEDREAKLAMLRRVMRERPRVARELLPETAFTVIQAALATERDAHVLSYLVRVASHTGGAAVVRVLAPCLGHTDARVVSNTLEALALTEDETVFTLALPLIARTEPRIRATALAVMCKFDRTAALEAMVNYLKNARDAQQRHGALFALRAVGGLPVALLESLQGEVEDPEVKEALARILEEASPEGLPRMMRQTRHTLALALTGRKTGSIFGALFPKRAVVPTLAAATVMLGAASLFTSPHEAGLPREVPPRAVVDATPRGVARAKIVEQLPPSVEWTGEVTRAGSGVFAMRVGDYEVRVELDERMTTPRPGAQVRVVLRPDLPGVTGGISGRAKSLDVLRAGPGADGMDREMARRLPPGQEALWKQLSR